MVSPRYGLYTTMMTACLGGYGWLYLNFFKDIHQPSLFSGCLFKHVTDVPCPSCGSTRSILMLARGGFLESLQMNPLGYLIASMLLIIPPWLAYDLVFKKRTFLKFYLKMESILKRPGFAIPLLLLVIVNWIWNINKGL